MDAADPRLFIELSRDVTGAATLQEVLDRSFAALRRLVVFDGGALQLIADGHLAAAATDPPASPDALTVRIPVGQGVSGRIAADGEPIYIADIATDERVHPEGRTKGLSPGGVRSYFGAPLIMDGAPIGVLQIDARRVGAFSLEDRTRVLTFLPTIAAAVQAHRLRGGVEAAAADAHALRERLRRALDINDTIAQGLTVAKYAHDLGDEDLARESVEQALRTARRVIDELIGPSAAAGDLRRSAEASVVDGPESSARERNS
jgi:GAF domain-containing protein